MDKEKRAMIEEYLESYGVGFPFKKSVDRICQFIDSNFVEKMEVKE